MMSKRNPKWTRDELILALNLYFRANPLHTTNRNPKIRELSDFLNQLSIHTRIPDKERFRNPNSVYMKLCNFLRLDPDYSGKGLAAGSKVDEEIWNEFASDRDRLARTAWAIRANSGRFSSASIAMAETEDEFPEGIILTRIHRLRETDQRAVREKKRFVQASEEGLVCAICDFDFHEAYGEIGYGFAECHDTTPLTYLRAGVKPKLSELLIVCPNCHRMLHRSRPRLLPSDLRKIVLSKRRSK